MKAHREIGRVGLGLPLVVRQVSGHSMLPVLPPGTLVYGWRWFFRLVPGDIVVILQSGKEKIKRIEKIEENRLYVTDDYRLHSDNSRRELWLDRDMVVAKIIWPHAPKHRAEGVDK